MSWNFEQIRIGKSIYRFYGLGKWECRVGRGGRWVPINAIYIPANALKIAASKCISS